ncbi:hypothetical protein PSH92_04875 [Pseudomonas beijingensis]|uniref:Uncharacterized protein n=1 Tax=Pseudomonas beijingensis TaxID=2954101 RepID=A0ABY9FF70_9PSED|nr:hypothetical protein [Pseudomonas sp. FP2034]WLH02205.1 hypothetical protein PSH92_04875 [Pseudomonas sp. FP2034]
MAVKVVAIRSEEGWSLLDNPQKLFPKMGEVEVRLKNISEHHPNDWISFQVAQREPRGKWKASIYRHLMPFFDLKEVGSLDVLRRHLTVDGLDGPSHSGNWVIRYSEDRILMLGLIRSSDNRYRMETGGSFNVYAYEPELSHNVPSDGADVPLYELKRGGECLEELDWASDEDYIKRIVRAMAAAHDSRADTVIDWLKRHADEATGQIGTSLVDRLAAQQSTRSGELAKRLLADKELLGELTEALLADPRLRSRLESEIQAIAEQERGSIFTSLSDELEREVKTLREQRLLEVDAELKSLEAEQREALSLQLNQDMTSNFLALSDRIAARQTEMEDELETQRGNLQQGLDKLAAQRETTLVELRTLSAQIEDGQTNLTNLQSLKSQAILEIARLEEQVASIHVPKSIKLESVLRFNPPQIVPVLSVGNMQQAITSCMLLTPVGKERMSQFLALMLAGEVPVIHGPETQDFLLTAEVLLSSGRSMRLEADPTVITFEDLWLRAGTQLPTSLTHGLELTCGQSSTTVLAVIEHAERSGARFWLPALADRSRRGELPRRFLVCTTVEDEECEEAQAIRSQAPWIDVSGAITPSGAALALVVFAPANVRQLDPGERSEDISPAMVTVARVANQLTLVNSLRLARAATEWVRLNPGNHYEQIPAALAEFFVNQSGRMKSKS